MKSPILVTLGFAMIVGAQAAAFAEAPKTGASPGGYQLTLPLGLDKAAVVIPADNPFD